jgi:hypothetical protein
MLSNLLEQQPESFLEYIQNSANNLQVLKWVNDITTYETWYSPGLSQLLYLVGDMADHIQAKKFFFGCDTTISEEIGIKIFDILLKFNPNLDLKDYFGKTFKDIYLKYEKEDGFRKNNKKFLEHIRVKLYSD